MLDYKWATMDVILTSIGYRNPIFLHTEMPVNRSESSDEYDWVSDGEYDGLKDVLPKLSRELRNRVINELREDGPTPIEETSIYRLLQIKSL